MHTTVVRRGFGYVVGLALIVTLCCSGCTQRFAPDGKPYCGDKTVKAITSAPGADPEVVYVCEGDIVTWKADQNVNTFEVDFKNDKSPFVDEGKHFEKAHPTSAKTKKHVVMKVYEYKITVNGQVYDPQVVGGGHP